MKKMIFTLLIVSHMNYPCFSEPLVAFLKQLTMYTHKPLKELDFDSGQIHSDNNVQEYVPAVFTDEKRAFITLSSDDEILTPLQDEIKKTINVYTYSYKRHEISYYTLRSTLLHMREHYLEQWGDNLGTHEMIDKCFSIVKFVHDKKCKSASLFNIYYMQNRYAKGSLLTRNKASRQSSSVFNLEDYLEPVE